MSNRRSTLVTYIALAPAVAMAAITFMAGSLFAAEVANGFDPSYRYVVNLASFREPVDPAALPRIEAFDKYLAYTTKIRIDSQDWHRLRIGFFPTREAAVQVMRSVRKEFPEAWVVKVSAGERARSRDYALFPGAAAPEAPAAPGQPEEEVLRPVTPLMPPPEESPSSLMAEAERAMTGEDYGSAIELYIEVLKQPESGFEKEARELMGLTYERMGDISQARAEYKTYLLLYPEGEGAERVRRRLAGLEAADVKPVERPDEERPEETEKVDEGIEEKLEKREGFFLGAGVTRVAIWGNLDGVTTVVGGGVTDVLPSVQGAVGIKLLAGYQFDRGSIEFNYSRSDHEGDFQGQEKPVKLRSYSLDGKVFPFREFYGVQPLLALGGGYNTLTVADGSTDGITTQDATFKGWDLRLGGGLEILLHERVAIDLLAIYRWGVYNSVDGIVSRSIDGHIDGNGLTASVETKFIF